MWHKQPSPVFGERIKHAIHLYRNKQVRAIIFTGGVGDNKLRVRVARNYALKNGVLIKHLFMDNQSTTIFQNIKNAKVIVDQQAFKSALIVSDPLHMKRAVSLAWNLIKLIFNPTPEAGTNLIHVVFAGSRLL